MIYRKFIKPISDFVISLICFLLTLPLMILVMIILAVALRGNPFFIQPRPGRNGKIFKIIKFKTMNNRRDTGGNLLPDAERLTRAGRIIRKSSLDEMPQLLNVIRGDMSLIGPRPLLVEYLPLYTEEQARRHEVKPGITGWAQVNGRNAITWEEKFKYDVWYVDHISFALDVKILFMTAGEALKREGISQEGHETIERFRGS